MIKYKLFNKLALSLTLSVSLSLYLCLSQVVISGALCTVEDYVIMSQCAHNKAIHLAAEGTVSVTDISQIRKYHKYNLQLPHPPPQKELELQISKHKTQLKCACYTLVYTSLCCLFFSFSFVYWHVCRKCHHISYLLHLI